MKDLTLAEMFSGIGGWSEAALMAGGITPIWHSEIDKHKIQKYETRHPGIPNLGDIRNITKPPYADIVTISFPCTGFSSAGKGEGFEDPNSRLWFEAERVIDEIRPEYAVIENIPNLTIRGLDTILASFARIGYDAEWCCLQGTQFGLQQRRKRIYFIAYPSQGGQQKLQREGVVFRKIQTGNGYEPMPVYPGWRTRRDIPEPRTYGSAYDLPGIVHRLEGTGDAIIPVIGMYILECIKIHSTHKQKA